MFQPMYNSVDDKICAIPCVFVSEIRLSLISIWFSFTIFFNLGNFDSKYVYIFCLSALR